LAVVVPLVLALGGLAGVARHWLEHLSAERYETEILSRTRGAASRLASEIVRAEESARMVAALLGAAAGARAVGGEAAARTALRAAIEGGPRLAGAAAAFRAHAFSPSRRLFAPYVRRAGAELERGDLAAAGDYLASPPGWFRLGLEAAEGVWVCGARDESGAPGDLCSYALPIERGGERIGVARVDVPFAALEPPVLEPPVLEQSIEAHLIIVNPGNDVQVTGAPPAGDPLAWYQRLARDIGGREAGALRLGAEAGAERPHWAGFAALGPRGWTLVLRRPDLGLHPRVHGTRDGLILAAGVVVMVVLLAALLAGRRLARMLARFEVALAQLAAGDLSARVDTSASGELATLAGRFNETAGELELHVAELARSTAAGETVEGELRAARRIQARLLPQAFPEHEAFEVHGVNASAQHVGGDFFDCFFADEGALTLVVADVSGKGVPAAMLMAVSMTLVRSLVKRGLAPAEVLQETNRLLLENRIGSMYLTLFVARYEVGSGVLVYANGAHPPALVVGTDNEVRPIGEPTGTVVGLLGDAGFAQGSTRLERGELLVLYTDGVTEARSCEGRLYGSEPLRRLLSAYADAPPSFLCDLIVREVNGFQGGERADDLTLLMLRRLR